MARSRTAPPARRAAARRGPSAATAREGAVQSLPSNSPSSTTLPVLTLTFLDHITAIGLVLQAMRVRSPHHHLYRAGTPRRGAGRHQTVRPWDPGSAAASPARPRGARLFVRYDIRRGRVIEPVPRAPAGPSG